MNCEKISEAIEKLKVNERGNIRGKRKVIDEIQSMHLNKLYSELMDVRVFVAKLPTGYSTKEALKMIDDFIYKKQVE